MGAGHWRYGYDGSWSLKVRLRWELTTGDTAAMGAGHWRYGYDRSWSLEVLLRWELVTVGTAVLVASDCGDCCLLKCHRMGK